MSPVSHYCNGEKVFALPVMCNTLFNFIHHDNSSYTAFMLIQKIIQKKKKNPIISLMRITIENNWNYSSENLWELCLILFQYCNIIIKIILFRLFFILNNDCIKKKQYSKIPIPSVQFYFTNIHNLNVIYCSEIFFFQLLVDLNNSILNTTTTKNVSFIFCIDKDIINYFLFVLG